VDASQMKAVIVVDDKEFNTLTYREAAFVGTGKPEADLTAAMQRGKEAKVIWTSKDGKTAVDRYDLTGFTSAKNDIDRSCK
jgi:serine/threonine-protein kinase RIO1